MSEPTDRASHLLGPEGGSAYPAGPGRLAGTTGEDSPASKLTVGRMATIKNGAQAIRYSLRGKTGQSAQVATTDPILAAYGELHWVVTPSTTVPYVESEDASTSYECWVYHSSP